MATAGSTLLLLWLVLPASNWIATTRSIRQKLIFSRNLVSSTRSGQISNISRLNLVSKRLRSTLQVRTVNHYSKRRFRSIKKLSMPDLRRKSSKHLWIYLVKTVKKSIPISLQAISTRNSLSSIDWLKNKGTWLLGVQTKRLWWKLFEINLETTFLMRPTSHMPSQKRQTWAQRQSCEWKKWMLRRYTRRLTKRKRVRSWRSCSKRRRRPMLTVDI